MQGESPSLIPQPDPVARERRTAALSMLFSGAALAVGGLLWWGALTPALSFAAALLGFFAAHEAGHWVTARRHGIAIGLPVFLPVGVVMRLRELPRTRTGLLEMGAMGPLSGLVAVAAIIAIDLAGPGAPAGEVELGAPLIWQILAWALTGSASLAPSSADPLAAAAMVGCLVTTLNLLPWGQLDGGHVAAALAPHAARPLGWVVTVALLAAGAVWPGWPIWAAMIHLAASRHPLTARESRPPSRRARWVAFAAFAAFALCFSPRPFY